MKRKKPFSRVVFILICLVVLFSSSASAELSIGNYTMVKQSRVSRVEYNYTFKADITNSGVEVDNVTTTLTSNSPFTTVVEGMLNFGKVGSGETVTSTNTFTVRQNRRYPFNPDSMVWNFDYVIETGEYSYNYETYRGDKIVLPVSPEGIVVKFQEGVTLEQIRTQLDIGSDSSLFADMQELTSPTKILLQFKKGISPETVIEQIDQFSQNYGLNIDIVSPLFKIKDTRMAVSDDFIVQFKTDATDQDISNLNNLFGVTILKEDVLGDKSYLLKVENKTSKELLEIVDQYHKNSIVEYAAPNFIRLMKPKFIPNDPKFGDQWNLHNLGQRGIEDADIDALEGWDISTGSTPVTIAIIDDGVDLNHEDLNLVEGFDATVLTGVGTKGAPLKPWDGHGTACAGIAAAVTDNFTGIAGINWNAKIMPIRIAHSRCKTCRGWITDDISIAKGIKWAADNGADVLSNSWGGGSDSYAINFAIKHAKDKGRNGKGSVVVFASGNDNGAVHYPANIPTTFAVGASSPCDERKSPTSCDGEKWWGSNYGSELDVVAPGVKIYTTDITGEDGYTSGNYTSTFNGTSAATPHVAGLASLIISIDPSLSATEVEEIIRNTADDIGTPGRDNETGYGRINVFIALNSASGGQPVPPPIKTYGRLGIEPLSVINASNTQNQNLYVPWLNENGFGVSRNAFPNTSTVQCVTDFPCNITVIYHDRGGNLLGIFNKSATNLDGGFPLGFGVSSPIKWAPADDGFSNVNGGTIEISSNSQIIGTTEWINKNGTSMGSMEMINKGSTTLQIPWFNDGLNSNLKTWFMVHNTTSLDANISVTYWEPSGNSLNTFQKTIPPNGLAVWRPVDDLGGNHAGSAIITSNVEIVGLVDIEDGGQKAVSAYPMSSETGSTSLYIPWFQQEQDVSPTKIDSWYLLKNISSNTANTVIIYRDLYGHEIGRYSQNIPPNTVLVRNPSEDGIIGVGSIFITSDANLIGVTGHEPLNNDFLGIYPILTKAGNRLATARVTGLFPFDQKPAYKSYIAVQNVTNKTGIIVVSNIDSGDYIQFIHPYETILFQPRVDGSLKISSAVDIVGIIGRGEGDTSFSEFPIGM